MVTNSELERLGSRTIRINLSEINQLAAQLLSALQQSVLYDPNLCSGGAASESGPTRARVERSSGRSQRGAHGDQGHHISKKFASYRRIPKISSLIQRAVPDSGYEVWRQAHTAPKKKDILREEGISRINQQVIKRRQEYSKILEPMSGVIALCADFPHVVSSTSVRSTTCFPFEPLHYGRFNYDVHKEAHKLRFKCQLINFVLALYQNG